ncbi:nitroreductase/quinone reductase family protein [Streptomyces sp. NPDC090127]|uniref:nitroreductase/quinone reductase family protein n=1 Tax=Streptomyces sp. NPDC090127 TaxID=3365953 RepID=UPI003811F463
MKAAWQRLLILIGPYPWAAAIGRRTAHADALLRRWSRGRIGLISVHGMTPFLLTTTGRTSGLPRTSALLCVLDGPDLIVAGSNFGRPHHPHWSANLVACPAARVQIRGVAHRARACLVTDTAEHHRLWTLLVAACPTYDTYAARTPRRIRIFRLSPVSNRATRSTCCPKPDHPATSD